ncbi:MAG TPA: STAS domain-containing protein [Gammaproteobacteria bacterium]|nr:STAS domain-containing protein [Gammaproteobacteria bacterium]
MEDKAENPDAEKTVITCEPNINISNASTLYEHLKEALQENRAVEINAGDVAKVDTAILQVFFAFSLEAKNAGLSVSWGSASEAFREAVALLGMQNELALPKAA